ncbi:hypothetical protein [Kribbella shirazensis]|uniref:Uncharacterized protein n=1 Tax=Kribbella shirazensis TaxID=1105143 RepID=A0A7X6A3A0_9ACTN|nr:hypothetical protein [Kribbella shirazensis]NIK60156.1 hypothetical protein [Kribbella shirazensis]
MSLEDELRAVGRSAVVPPVADDLTAAVLTRVADLPVRKRLRDRWRAFVAGFLVLVAGAALTPPVRATVAEWLQIGGVQAQPVGSGPSTAPPPPTVSGHLSVDQAASVAGFTPKLPKALGAPSGMEASRGFIAASWDGLRLEQFQSGISPLYAKKYYDRLERVPEVNGFWFSTPHELVLLDERVVRIAGPTLVWERDGVTFRLEGAGKARAVELAAGTF